MTLLLIIFKHILSNPVITTQGTRTPLFLIEMGFNILEISKRLGHEKVETTWHTYAHLYPDILNLLQQFQGQLGNQPTLIDISQEEIVCWDPLKKEKSAVTKDQFEEAAEVTLDTEAGLAVAKIFQAGYLEICGLVYCLASRGLSMKYL